MKDHRRKKHAGKPGAGDATHVPRHAGSMAPGEIRTRKLIEAAYRFSTEVGQDLEAILKTGSSNKKLASLHAKIVKGTKNRQTAERVYAAIFAALHPP